MIDSASSLSRCSQFDNVIIYLEIIIIIIFV